MSNNGSDHVVVQIEEAEPRKDHFDEDLLHRAIHDAGRWAFGTVVVEIWVLNKQQTELFRPEGGWWVDPAWHHCDNKAECKLCRLSDPSAPGYEPPPPVAPGIGLAGVLWSDSQSSTRRRRTDGARGVVWRDLHALQQDPDQPDDGRLKRVGDVGLGYAGGVAFNSNGQKGIVIFVARSGVDLCKLRSETNETYLRSASDLIGSAWALRGPRQAVQMERKKELDAALRRARIKIQAMIAMGIPLSTLAEAPKQEYSRQESLSDQYREGVVSPVKIACVRLWHRLVATARKCLGAGVPPSPLLTWEQSIWTFFGVFATLLILTNMNTHIDDKRFDMELGPFGALMTLQHGLTAAPASQPTNAIVGQAVSLAIAIGIASIPGLNLWMRQSLATALAVSCMVKLGITHPPAGAAALIFAGSDNSWGNLAMMLVGNIIAIITSTIINNLNSKRQYPLAWGVGWAFSEFKRRWVTEDKEDKDD